MAFKCIDLRRYLTGEMVFPFMFDDIAALAPLKPVVRRMLCVSLCSRVHRPHATAAAAAAAPPAAARLPAAPPAAPPANDGLLFFVCFLFFFLHPFYTRRAARGVAGW